MWVKFFTYFVKITGWIAQKIVFRTQIFYEDKNVQGRILHGPVILISNHHSVFDYAVYLFVFPFNVIHTLAAEVLYQKNNFMRFFLKSMGMVFVDRNNKNSSSIDESMKVLNNKGVIQIFPEGRLPKKGEQSPLPFHDGTAFLALQSGALVVPCYCNNKLFTKDRVKTVIGKPIDVSLWVDKNKSDKENLKVISEKLRQKVISLGGIINE